MPYTFRHGDRPLDGLTVQRAVGRGGFGEVYYALTDSGKQVALKYLRENPEIELRGISHVMNLKSPHLITIYDVRESAHGEPFVVMEYVGGPSLRDLLVAEPDGLGAQKAAFFIDGVARGLAYLHERGIVHRDLKPANIFYDDGYVKIGDYGLSKHISVSKHSGQTVSVGTVHYMAPEIGSGSYTKGIDIYALGVILYEMLTGRLPFAGSSMGEILMRHLSDRPDLAGIPEPYAGVIAKALAKDPADRFQDASEMADALRQSADFSASVASFDPTSLNDVPRSEPGDGNEATMTTPPRVPPPPPLDVHATHQGGRPDFLSDKLHKKADKLQRILHRKVEKLARKHGGGRPAAPPAVPARPHASAGAEAPDQPRNRFGHLLVLGAITIAVSIGLAILTDRNPVEEHAAGYVFSLLGLTAGVLLAYFKVLQQAAARGPMWDRIVYVGVAAVFLIPAFGIASEVRDPLPKVVLTLLISLLFCDWTKRIDNGRTGSVDFQLAFWPALVALISCAIMGVRGPYTLTAIALCATAALLVQAAAALWPFPLARQVGGGRRGGRGQSFWRQRRSAWHRPPAPAPDAAGSAAVPAPPAGAGEAPNADATPAPPQQQVVLDRNAPSFVSRTANAGLAFFGKLLLVGGLLLAMGLPIVEQRWSGHPFQVRIGDQIVSHERIPEPLLIGVAIAGSMMMVLARRRAGGAHLLRGVIGCALALWALVMALGPASHAVQLIFTTDWEAIRWVRIAGPLATIGLPLVGAFILLSWPHTPRYRDEIVI